MARKTYILNCRYCGKEFEATTYNVGFCSPEHKKLNTCKRQREYRKKRLGLKTEADMLKAKAAKKRMSELAEINAEARKRGMTYGQYMGWLHFN